jgi:arylsulfatase A-like enzyme
MRRVPGERGLRFGATVLTVAILLSSGILALANSRTPELPRRSEGPPDVLIVVLDTTRADFVPAPADSPYGTPNLERLTLEGVLFERAFSTSCWTLPAHASLFTGLAPTEHGASWRTERLPPGPPTLAETFAAAGWRTGAFSANPWVSREFGFGRGFAVFAEADADRRPRPPWQARLLPGLFDRLDASLVYEDKGGFSLTANLLRFLERDGTRPVFAFLNLMEPHLPYRPPRRVLGELEGTGWTHESLASVNQDPLHDLTPGAVRTRREIEALRRLYAAEIAYADSLLGRILDALERSGRLDRTLIVVTSDHGENLGDHPPLDHQLGLWDTLVHVPLVLRYPDWRAGGVRIDDLVSLADVPKAVLHLAGIEAGGGPVLGATKRDAIFVEYDRPVWILERIRSRLGLDPTPWDRDLQGLRTADRKWIESSDGRHHAYELRSDPGERRNLVGAAGNAPPEFAELALHLTETRNTLSEQFQEETESVLSEEARRKLRALGYLH